MSRLDPRWTALDRQNPRFTRLPPPERSTAGMSRAWLEGRPVTVRWALLAVLTLAFAVGLQSLRLSAAWLLGPMVAAILIAIGGGAVRVPRFAFLFAQAIVGCLFARAFTPTILSEILRAWPLFVAGVLSVVVASIILGWLLARSRVLPGTTAIWGSFPGAATAMTVMCEAFGADARLVAFMQYLRVVLVAVIASGVARISVGQAGAGPIHSAFFSAVAWGPLVETLAVAIASVAIALGLRLRAGPLMVAMALGALLQDVGGMRVELPPLLLAPCYMLVGWSIGSRFTREISRPCGARLSARRRLHPHPDCDLRRLRRGARLGHRRDASDGVSGDQPGRSRFRRHHRRLGQCGRALRHVHAARPRPVPVVCRPGACPSGGATRAGVAGRGGVGGKTQCAAADERTAPEGEAGVFGHAQSETTASGCKFFPSFFQIFCKFSAVFCKLFQIFVWRFCGISKG